MFRPWETSTDNPSTSGEISSQCKKRFLSEDAQDVVLSVYKTLLHRMGQKGVIKETAIFTNVSERTVRRIVSAGTTYLPRKRVKIPFKKIDNITEEFVKRTVYDLYCKNEVPTLKEIHTCLVTSKVGFEYSETTLWRLLKKLGFKYRKLNERRLIMESQRNKILSKMEEESIAEENSLIKTEPEEFVVRDSDRSLDDAVRVKLELEELYGDHEIHEDMVIGPTIVNRPVTNYHVIEHGESSQDSELSLQNEKEIENNLPNKSNSLTHILKSNTTLSKQERKMQKNKQKQIMKKNANTVKDEGYLSCDCCDKKFKYLSKLVQHRNVHSNKILFSCDSCDKAFRKLSNLKRHKMTHTNERQFFCDICQKKLRRADDLSEHKFIHTGDNPFNCEVCNKEFRYSRSLLYHKKFHEGFKGYPCDVCNKYFTQRSNLTIHKNNHSGKKPFSCDVCQKQYVTKDSLKQHIITHSDKKPFSCTFCTKTNKRYKLLRLHKQKCHCNNNPQ